MLYPIATETRHTIDLNGIWKFLLDDGSEVIDTSKPIQMEEVIAVPGSFNDQAIASLLLKWRLMIASSQEKTVYW